MIRLSDDCSFNASEAVEVWVYEVPAGWQVLVKMSNGDILKSCIYLNHESAVNAKRRVDSDIANEAKTPDAESGPVCVGPNPCQTCGGEYGTHLEHCTYYTPTDGGEWRTIDP